MRQHHSVQQEVHGMKGWRWLAGAIAAVMVVTLAAGGAWAQTYRFRLANYFPAPAAQSKVLDEFVADLERLSNGRIVIEHYPGGTLLGPAEIFDGVTQGIAHIGLSNLAYTFGRFVESEILDLPVGFPNAWVANRVAQDFYDRYTPREWAGTRVLALHASPVNNIITKDRPVRRLEDLRGLALRGTGYVAREVEALGATARPISMPEAYDNLAKNVIDGLLIPYETTVTFGLCEDTRYITEVLPKGKVHTFYLVMSEDACNSLTPDLQAVMDEYVKGEFREKLYKMWNDIDIVGYEYAVGEGYEFIQLTPEELARWQQVADRVIDDYVASMVAKGYSEADMRERIAFVRERIAYWTEQQKAQGVKSSTGPDEVRVGN